MLTVENWFRSSAGATPPEIIGRAGLLDEFDYGLSLGSGAPGLLTSIEEWRFKAPIRDGDTLHAVIDIEDARLTRDGSRGVLARRVSLVNQRDEICQEGLLPLLVKCKP
jgi:acyl dehydratase